MENNVWVHFDNLRIMLHESWKTNHLLAWRRSEEKKLKKKRSLFFSISLSHRAQSIAWYQIQCTMKSAVWVRHWHLNDYRRWFGLPIHFQSMLFVNIFFFSVLFKRQHWFSFHLYNRTTVHDVFKEEKKKRHWWKNLSVLWAKRVQAREYRIRLKRRKKSTHSNDTYLGWLLIVPSCDPSYWLSVYCTCASDPNEKKTIIILKCLLPNWNLLK